MTIHDLHEYSRTNNIGGIRAALDAGADVNLRDRTGKTPLLSAIAWKAVKSVTTLLECGADVLAQDSDGATAIHYAIEHNLPKVLEALVERCPEAISISDKHGNQPLWTAAFNARGNYEMVSTLLRYGADPNHRNNVNLSPLDIPKRINEPALLQVLEKSHAKPS